MCFDVPYTFSSEPFKDVPIVKPNRITGEGRMRLRGRDKRRDQKKHQRRKMAKQSRRKNNGK